MTETDHLMVGFSHSEDGWKFIHFINGINVFNGGKVLDYADSQIIGALTDKLQKRYPNIKRNDVKNKVIFHYVVKELPLPRFADQIKSESVNLPSQYPEIAEEVREIASSRFIDKVYKDKSITGPIIDLFKAKEAIKDKKDLEKSVKKIKRPLKYWAAQGDKKYLVISEGDSAIGSIINGVGRKGYGFYPIKGKTSNVLKDPKKLKSDKELLEISNILGIDFSNNQKEELPLSDEFFEIEINGETIIANLNDEILINNKWILVKDLINGES
jgi:DNA gyrase/topoisomerase IV subunit B